MGILNALKITPTKNPVLIHPLAIRVLAIGGCLSMFTIGQSAEASLSSLTFSNALEDAAAIANQRTFDELNTGLCAGFEARGTGAGSCSGAVFSIYSNVRELVHTANEIAGTGSTQWSLGTGLTGLGFALRWTAGEEFAAQGSMAGNFVNGQLSSLASRLEALRAGAQGFHFAQYDRHSPYLAEGAQRPRGGAAGGEQYTPWGGFINYSYGSGEREPTVFEDAFDFDGTNLNFGVDYRVDDQWIVGVVVGYSDQSVDFDSAQSIVDGGLEGSGLSVMPFVSFQKDQWYASGSLGIQSMDFDVERFIKYPSFNPSPFSSSTDTQTQADTSASVLTYFLEGGYSFQWQAFGFSPYLSYNARMVDIDGFVEQDLNNDGFDLAVDEQSVDSGELSVGLRFQYTWTPRFGVIIPYLNLAYINEHKDDFRIVTARYANLPDEALTSPLVNFSIQTDKPDDQYTTWEAGVSSVIRGVGTDKCGNVYGGLQAFLSYKEIKGLDFYDHSIIQAGLRYEVKPFSCW